MANDKEQVMTTTTTPDQIEKALKRNKESASAFIRQRMSELNAELEEWNELLYRIEGN